MRFAIAVDGGTQAGCSDETFAARRAALDGAPVPVLTIPGATDWVDCGRPEAGDFDPRERLLRWRELFTLTNTAFGSPTLRVVRQSDMSRYAEFSENTRWEYGSALFVGINLPGGNNDFRVAGGRNGEFEDRIIANRVWLERAFGLAQTRHLPALVIAVEGDPHWHQPLRPPDRRLSTRDGYFEFKVHVRDLAARFHGEVLVIHAGEGRPTLTEPVAEPNGRRLRNVFDLTLPPGGVGGQWTLITVDPRVTPSFRVNLRPWVAPPPLPAPAPSTPDLVPASSPGSAAPAASP